MASYYSLIFKIYKLIFIPPNKRDFFMTKKERYQFVINYFVLNSPDAKTELIYDNPYQLLVAVILSAQCTDKRVNLTTPAIFNIILILNLSVRQLLKIFFL